MRGWKPVSTSLTQPFFADQCPRNAFRNDAAALLAIRVERHQGACAIGHVLARARFGLTDGGVLASALHSAEKASSMGSERG